MISITDFAWFLVLQSAYSDLLNAYFKQVMTSQLRANYSRETRKIQTNDSL